MLFNILNLLCYFRKLFILTEFEMFYYLIVFNFKMLALGKQYAFQHIKFAVISVSCSF